jgi:two-component system chemotaxis response regulator CheB
MIQPLPISSPPLSDDSDPCRVIIVDDSIVIRGWIKRMLEANKDIKIVATAADGKMAIDTLKRTPADPMQK